MPEQRCIYCSPSHPAEAPYADEHVLPVLTGQFQNALILDKGVCENCVKFFTTNLDPIFNEFLAFADPSRLPEDILREMIGRSIARIAFNYLVYVTGIGYAARENFDPIRYFIRFGKPAGYQTVELSTSPVDAVDRDGAVQKDGHLVTLDWSLTHMGIISQIRLHPNNFVQVILTKNYYATWRPLRSGHYYNLSGKIVEPSHFVQAFGRSIPRLP